MVQFFYSFTCFELIKSLGPSFGDSIVMASGNDKIVIGNRMTVCSQDFSFSDIDCTGCNDSAIGEIIFMVDHRPCSKWWLHHWPQACPWNFKILLPDSNLFSHSIKDDDSSVHGKFYKAAQYNDLNQSTF